MADGAEQPAGATEEVDEFAAIWGDAPRRRPAAKPASSQEDDSEDESSSDDSDAQSRDSYFVESDGGESEDSAVRRRREAEERIVDLGPTAGAAAGGAGSLLPSADSALAEVSGPPEYLNPEATRPLADSIHRRRLAAAAAAAEAAKRQAQAAEAGPSGKQHTEPWDISRMAPKMKGQNEEKAVGVITGAAVRYKTDERLGDVSAAAVAMLGGQLRDDAGEDDDGGDGGGGARGPERAKGPSKAMGVTDFLDKGVGGAKLPRKRQERAEKEKAKRMRGQSAIGEWKSEAEMVLRQQYD